MNRRDAICNGIFVSLAAAFREQQSARVNELALSEWATACLGKTTTHTIYAAFTRPYITGRGSARRKFRLIAHARGVQDCWDVEVPEGASSGAILQALVAQHFPVWAAEYSDLGFVAVAARLGGMFDARQRS